MGLLRSTATVSSMTLLSRVLGLIRDQVFAIYFPGRAGTDAFLVAFRIPNFFRRLFAEGAFSQAFVPVLTEYRGKRSPEEVQDLINHVCGTLGGVLLAITLLGVAAAPLVITVFAFGFSLYEPDKYQLTVEMLRLTFPYLFFISLVAFAGAVLNSFQRFWVPAFTPVLLNVTLIGAVIFLSPMLEVPVKALAWGVLFAGAVQLAFQWPFLQQLRLLPRPRWGFRHEGVRHIGRLMLPAIFGSSVVQINLLVDTLIASFLATGSVTWLYFSDRMVEFPLGVFGIALATVILPSLSREHAAASAQRFSATLDWALRWVWIIATPATIGLMVLATPILATLFQYGGFTGTDVYMTSLSLMAYALGLPGFILVKVLAPGYFARQDIKTPVRIGIIAMLANMLLNVAFVVPLVMWAFEGPHVGLALATALSSYINAALLWRGLRKQGVYMPLPGWGRLVIKVLVAVTLMMLALLWLGPGAGGIWGSAGVDDWQALAWYERGWQLGASVVIGAAVYLLLLYAMGIRLGQLRTPIK